MKIEVDTWTSVGSSIGPRQDTIVLSENPRHTEVTEPRRTDVNGATGSTETFLRLQLRAKTRHYFTSDLVGELGPESVGGPRTPTEILGTPTRTVEESDGSGRIRSG